MIKAIHKAVSLLVMAMLSTTATAASDTGDSNVKTASITIDTRKKFQHVTGFGGFSPSPQWSYWLNDTQMNQLFGKASNQLGLNILRLYIGNNRNSWSASVANAKAAKRNGAFIFASPWSPPAEWKSNNSDSNGGYLLEEHYADWANFLNDYYLYMKGQGVEIDAISIQNEPDWNASYQSCIWTGAQMAKFLREQGSKIQCKIIAPEAIHFTRSVHEPILNDPEACKELDIVGGHFYGWDGSSYPLAAQKGKEVWMTEYLINERQQNEGKNIDWQNDGFLFAQSINDAMLANMSAWVHYSLKRYYAIIGDGEYGTVNNAITKRGYILSQYAKYASNTTRIGHLLNDQTGQLRSSAYLSNGGDSVSVVVINPSPNKYTTTITLPFYSVFGVTTMTSEAENWKRARILDDSNGDTYTSIVEVEPYTVNTFIYRKSKDREDLPDADEEENVIFQDNLDVTGASCVPPGWKVKWEEGYRTAGNYSAGPRVMGFSPEGKMQYAFYFRTNTASAGYLSYGEENNYHLTLEPGKYTLTYSTLGWKAIPSLRVAIQKLSGNALKLVDVKPTVTISANGSSSRITETSDETMDFEITEKGDYMIKWVIQKASAGLTEALVGNVRLVRHADIIKGDANGDGKVTLEDANCIIEYYLGIRKSINLEAADVSGDGRVTIEDANAIIGK